MPGEDECPAKYKFKTFGKRRACVFKTEVFLVRPGNNTAGVTAHGIGIQQLCGKMPAGSKM